jgi:uncharacterized protein (DUF4415 family)
MNAKSEDLPKAWVDPDDAPEITEALIASGKWKVDGRVVTRNEALAELGMEDSATVTLDTEVVDAFRRHGEGWQAKMNAALREWLATHQVV